MKKHLLTFSIYAIVFFTLQFFNVFNLTFNYVIKPVFGFLFHCPGSAILLSVSLLLCGWNKFVQSYIIKELEKETDKLYDQREKARDERNRARDERDLLKDQNSNLKKHFSESIAENFKLRSRIAQLENKESDNVESILCDKKPEGSKLTAMKSLNKILLEEKHNWSKALKQLFDTDNMHIHNILIMNGFKKS